MPLHVAEAATDDLFRALANPDRRRLLHALKERDQADEISVPEVVRGGEREVDVLRRAFHHNHLPMLESLEVITWDREENTVGKGPEFGDVRPALDLMDDHRDDLPDGVG